ncbi:MAG: hypothetical protein Q8P32_03750 [Candidatus Komeilibacteria bacterium]|nr:hypothetical protein [Candidatus Komeilibacteria bacterium]
MADARKLDQGVEQELARLLTVVKKKDRQSGRHKKQSSSLPAGQGTNQSPLPAQAGPTPNQPTDNNQQDQEENQPTPQDQSAQSSNNQPSNRQRAKSFINQAQNIVESRSLNELGDKQFKHDYERFKNAASIKTPLGAIKEGFLLGQSLRQGIASGRFSSFLLAILLAFIKDFWDMLEPTGISSSIVNIFITMALLMVVSFQGVWFKTWLIKKFAGKAILAILVEFLPFVTMFPTYIFMVLLIKIKNDKHIGSLKSAADEMEAELGKVKFLGK